MEWRTSEEEEKYFAEQDRRLRLGIKAAIQRSQAELDRALAVAGAVGSNEVDIGDALLELGFTAEDARILPFIPLVVVAWADGKMGDDEAALILDAARAQGMSATTAAYKKLDELTRARPSDAFFSGSINVLRELLHEKEPGLALSKASTAELMHRVATAQGGFFGFGNKVSDEEKSAIDKLVAQLGL